MAAYDALSELPLLIDDYELEGRSRQLGPFERRTSTIHLQGGGEEAWART